MITVWLSFAMAADLTGVVQDAAGEPLADVLVVAYDHRLSYELDTTDSDGAFRIDDLSAGPRRLRLLPLDDVPAEEMYFPTGLDLCAAEPMELTRNEERFVGPVALPGGGRITGRVLRPDGSPAVDVEVVGRSAADEVWALARDTSTDDDGRFELNGLTVSADGSEWRLELRNADDLPNQYLGGVYEEELGQVVSLVDGAADVGSWTLLPGGSLSGTVSTPDGGVADGEVFALTTFSTRSVQIVDGAWTLSGLAPGEASVWVEAEGYAQTWWPGTPGPQQTLSVTDGEEEAGLEVALGAEAVVGGQLLGADDFSGSLITLADEANDLSVSATVEVDGTFSVDGLNPGLWRLGLIPSEGLGLVEGDLRDPDETPMYVTLSAGENPLGELEVDAGAEVRGKAFDRDTGEPIYGAWIYVENIDTGLTRLARAERNGRYAAEGLAPGTYRVWAEFAAYCPGDPDWVARYYPDQVNPALVASIPLAPGQVAKWDPPMAQDADHDHMGDAWEAHYGLALTLDDGDLDLDQDGYSNREEYLLGTDPSRVASAGCGCGHGTRGPAVPWFAAAILGLLLCRNNLSPKRQLPV